MAHRSSCGARKRQKSASPTRPRRPRKSRESANASSAALGHPLQWLNLTIADALRHPTTKEENTKDEWAGLVTLLTLWFDVKNYSVVESKEWCAVSESSRPAL